MSQIVDRLRNALAGRYTVEREVGRGGMATVYLARDVKHNRLVALKVLHPELAASLGTERFLREIQIASRLTHPHILPLHDSGDADGLLYYVMPYVDGEALRARLTREGRLPPDDVGRITREVASALDYAHRNGIVHRDVKPENVLFVDSQAVIADFGIARAVSRASEGESLTATGIAVGTPAYISPEQAGAEPTVDGRSDIYSLGCVVYEMLAGEPPFYGRTAREVIMKHFSATPAPLRESAPLATAAMCAAVARALEKDPDDRFATAADFAAALGEPAPAAAAARNSAIGIMNFTNLSGDPAVDWLGSGIAETLTADLKKVTRLRILDRGKLMQALGTRAGRPLSEHDVFELGRTVGARWIVWGTFQKSGNRIRITPHYTDAVTGELLAAEKIDGPMDEIFALQDRVVLDLMRVIDVELSAAELQGITRPETVRLGAYEHYAKGKQLFTEFGRSAFDRAEQHFRQALGEDPDYALAHSGLGSIFAFRYIAHAKREDLDLAIPHLERAIALDPDLAEPHAWLAYAYMRQHRFAEAIGAGRRATELGPDSSMAFYMASLAYHVRGAIDHRPEDARPAVELYLRSIELEPGHQAAYMNLAMIYMNGGRYDVARRMAETAERIEDTGSSKLVKFVGALTVRATIHRREGELAEAMPILERAVQRYSASDHVHAGNFVAFSWCELGEIAYRQRANDVAIEHFTRAVRICEAHQEKLGIGYFVIRARLGLAKALHDLGMHRDEDREYESAFRLWQTRAGYVFSWVPTGSDADVWFDFASYHAAAGHADDALSALGDAVSAGWADPHALRDDVFRRIRTDPRFVELCGKIDRMPALPLLRLLLEPQLA